jgi:antitoxin component YwqK of YwqJK toxin-antitoxin module
MKYYHENGKLKRETTYDMGVKHGPEKVYDKNGKLISEGNYYYGEYAKK